MQSQTISGTLHIEKTTRPSFVVVVLDWMIYFLISHFLVMVQPTLFGFFLRYLVFFIALSTTFSFLFKPRYYTAFQATEDPSRENQKISSDTSAAQDSKSIPKSSLKEINTDQTQVISSDKTATPQFCAECGAKVEYSGRFCTACGSPVRV